MPVMHAENIRRRAFRHFSPLVQQNHFIETRVLRFLQTPDIIEPRSHFHARQRRRSMAPMLPHGQAHRLAV